MNLRNPMLFPCRLEATGMCVVEGDTAFQPLTSMSMSPKRSVGDQIATTIDNYICRRLLELSLPQ